MWAGESESVALTRQRFEEGTCKAVAEFAPQYGGLVPNRSFQAPNANASPERL